MRIHPDYLGATVAEEVMDDFGRMFPGITLATEPRQYLLSLIARAVAEVLRDDWDDGK